MLASTRSIRDYTINDLSPLLTQVPQHRVRFLAETVPAFGATTAFHSLQKKYPDYSYKEAPSIPPISKTVRPIGKATINTCTSDFQRVCVSSIAFRYSKSRISAGN